MTSFTLRVHFVVFFASNPNKITECVIFFFKSWTISCLKGSNSQKDLVETHRYIEERYMGIGRIS